MPNLLFNVDSNIQEPLFKNGPKLGWASVVCCHYLLYFDHHHHLRFFQGCVPRPVHCSLQTEPAPSRHSHQRLLRGAAKKKNVFFWEISPKSVYPTTHPRVFVRFGKTKGEIWVEKGDFRGDFGGFRGVWTLFGNQPPHPRTFGRDLPKKRFFYSFP